MTANIDPDTGVAYGYISANALHPDIVQELQDNGTDVYYADAVAEAKREAAREWAAKLTAAGVLDLDLYVRLDVETEESDPLDEERLEQVVQQYVESNWDGSDWEQRFHDYYQPDEPIHEGVKDGVKYRTSWLGGALNVFIFESPHITEAARRASPCVPNAGILDTLDGDVRAYDVPPEWRDTE